LTRKPGLRGGKTEFEDLPEITAHLEKALALNPQFAPAYATLANFYAIQPDTRDKALAMAKKPWNSSQAI